MVRISGREMTGGDESEMERRDVGGNETREGARPREKPRRGVAQALKPLSAAHCVQTQA